MHRPLPQNRWAVLSKKFFRIILIFLKKGIDKRKKV